jgi:hypothetical protein
MQFAKLTLERTLFPDYASYKSQHTFWLQGFLWGEIVEHVSAHPCSTCGRRRRRFSMKIVVIGGSGLSGKKLVHRLRGPDHQVMPADEEEVYL